MNSFAENKDKQPTFTRPAWQADNKSLLKNADRVPGGDVIVSPYPKTGALLSIGAVALTTIILAYSNIAGVYGVLLFYALWLPRSIYKGRLVIKPNKALLLQIIFAGYCVLSVIWSDFRPLTLRSSLEFVSSFLCVLIMARITSVPTFIRGLIVGIAITLLMCVASNRHGVDVMSGTYSLIGLFGSKNQVGLISEIGVLSCGVFFFTEKRLLTKLLYAVPTGLLSLVCLYMSRSMSSLASLMLVVAVLITAYSYPRLKGGVRLLALTLAAPVTLIGIGTIVAVKGTGLFKLFGKDATLTGRTYLWAQGIQVGLKDPFFGHGFGAFWVPGQPEAERYWYEFMIYNRSGFHFHDLYIQTFVDLGAIGLIVMIAMILSNVIKSFKLVIANKTSQSAFFLLALSTMFLIRAFVEVDFLGSFNIGVMLFFGTAIYLSMQQDQNTA